MPGARCCWWFRLKITCDRTDIPPEQRVNTIAWRAKSADSSLKPPPAQRAAGLRVPHLAPPTGRWSSPRRRRRRFSVGALRRCRVGPGRSERLKWLRRLRCGRFCFGARGGSRARKGEVVQSTFSRRAFVTGLGMLSVPLIALAQEREKKRATTRVAKRRRKKRRRKRGEKGRGEGQG